MSFLFFFFFSRVLVFLCWVDPPFLFLKEPHRGIEPGCGSLTLFDAGAALDTTARGGGAFGTTAAGAPCAAFGVFCCLCCVSDTEQQLMPVRHILFWNQVIQTNQFIFPALGPLIT